MKRALIILVCLSCLLGAAWAAGSDSVFVPLADVPGDTPTLRVVDARDGALSAEIRIPGLALQPRAFGQERFTQLVLAGGQAHGAPGQPLVPVIRRLIEIPRGAEVSLRLETRGTRRIALREHGVPTAVWPAQPSREKRLDAPEPAFTLDEALYGSAAPWPAEPVVLASRAVVRGRELALVEIRPFRVLPKSGEIEVFSEATLHLSTRGARSCAHRPQDSSRYEAATLAGVISVPELQSPACAAPPAATRATAAEGLLVIVHDDFASALDPFVDWKRKTGFKVEVVKLSELGGSPGDTEVKDRIQDAYDTWSNPSLGYVLMVGDTDFTPIHTGNGGGKSQVTDNWYACLDGSDYLPDLGIARISTRSAAETSDVVDKLVTYERATFASNTWVKRAGFVGTSDSGHISLIEDTHDDCIDTYYTPNGYEQTSWSHGYASCDRHYNTTNASTEDIAASINEGRTVFNYSGHGSETSWQGPTSHGGYDQNDVRGNTNDGMYPFVISNACITGKLDRQECFGETWQKAPNKGAIAFLGASNNSYWDEDDLYQRQLHDHIFPMDTTPAISLINNRAKLDLYNHYGDVGNVRYYYDMYNMLSEPTLSLWTRAPRTLYVSYASQVPTGSTEFEVTVERAGAPVEGALVAIHKSDEGLRAAGYTDASGKIVLPLDPAPMNPGTMEVTVTGHDDRPHEGSTEVIPVDGPWLRFVDHTLSDAIGGCDADGIGDVGELVEISVRFENIGSEAALDAQATLSSLADIAVLVNPISLGTVAPGEFGTAVFEVKIGAGIGCEELVTFDVHTTCTGADGWNSSFSESFEVDHRTDVELEGFEAGGAEPPGWTHGSDVGGDDWAIVDSSAHGGAWAYHSSGVAPQKDIHLVSAPLEPKGEASVSFWHRYDLSPDISGAFLQLSADGGANWVDLTERISGHVYNHEAGLGVDRRRVWAGTSSAWVQSTVDLNPWSGQTVHLRFRIGVVGGSGTGWWIDDVELRSVFVGCDVSPCGVPESVRLESVTLDGEVTVLTWWDDPVAQSFSVLRSADPTSFDAFSDVSHLDDDVTDGRFRDTEAGTFACWLVRGTGPDGEGALDHYGH